MVRWKNFLSTGNTFTEVNLQKSKSTLVVGTNGAGKSTMLDAICYALYGKPFRKISKPQLVNTINKKGAEVEVEFSIGKHDYLIRRGQKPIFLEVYQNGKMINQDAAVKDYQEQIEKHILKLNFKSFSQVVILGSASFTPFMQLSAMNRREVIEDLLDIQIFSTMNTLLKTKVNDNKALITDNEHNLDICNHKIKLTEDHIKQLEESNEEVIKQKMLKGKEIADNITAEQQKQSNILTRIEELNNSISDLETVRNKQKNIQDAQREVLDSIRRLNQEIKFFHDNDSCPTCLQGIEHDFKENKIYNDSEEVQESERRLDELEVEYNKITARLDEIAKVQDQVSECNSEITKSSVFISQWSNNISELKQEIIELKKSNKNITDNNNTIEASRQQLTALESEKEALLEERQVLGVASTLLKDSGIKTKIIKQYIPIMNKLINKYLAAMDFFVQFELDESFNEKIKSRFRDEFSYQSFSEGEKMRIDLALLFTWRAVAKLRNSATTNLLIMDEVFDSSLDGTGTEEFLKILNQLTTDTNVFIISHKGDQLFDKFHSVIKFEKHKNFSRIAA